jgi:hypothetical protein
MRQTTRSNTEPTRKKVWGMSTQAERDKVTALEALADIKPGDTIYTVLRHVSPSGMARWIDVYTIKDGELQYRSWYAAKAIGAKVNVGNHDGVKMEGCGMDMGFSLVYSLSSALFRDGFDCIGEDARCPSNDHSNRENRYHHPEGGYALRHRWI